MQYPCKHLAEVYVSLHYAHLIKPPQLKQSLCFAIHFNVAVYLSLCRWGRLECRVAFD